MIDATTRRQLTRFVITGLLATATDFSVYGGLLYTVLPGRYDIAKGISFLFGTTVSFLLNKFWTFESKEASARETGAFLVLYGVTFVLNIATNRGALETAWWLGVPEHVSTWTAVVMATTASMVANFIGQKLWVFRDRSTPEA